MSAVTTSHDYGEDACCRICGFDGAEWHWWKHHTYEGKASDAKSPLCTPHLPIVHPFEEYDYENEE